MGFHYRSINIETFSACRLGNVFKRAVGGFVEVFWLVGRQDFEIVQSNLVRLAEGVPKLKTNVDCIWCNIILTC